LSTAGETPPSARERRMEMLGKFREVFAGLDSAYGTYKIEKTNEKNKKVGKAVVVRQPPTDDIWR
jgi:rRNA processing protein Gar1